MTQTTRTAKGYNITVDTYESRMFCELAVDINGAEFAGGIRYTTRDEARAKVAEALKSHPTLRSVAARVARELVTA